MSPSETVSILPSAKINPLEIGSKLISLSYAISIYNTIQFVNFKPLSYCFEETIGSDVMASFASRPVSRLIRSYNKPGDITKEC